jgi:homocysteine S-methyltransferase
MWKVDAGADVAVTQPVFDSEAFFRFLDKASEWPIPVLAGLWPLRSLRETEFLANEVPGVVVPPAVVERMRSAQAKGPVFASEEGVAIAREILGTVSGRVRGVHLHVPGGELDRALSALEGLD